MLTMKSRATIDRDGHLKLDLPTGLPAGEMEVEVIIRQAAPAEKRRDLSRFVGRFTHLPDPVAFQRGLRDEWPE